MESVSVHRWPAPAKLNLMLHVVGRRPDGYHELQTVFHLIDLMDAIDISVREDGMISRPSGPAGVPEDQDLVVPDLVGDHLERPRAVERRVQARDHRVALDVVEDAVSALALLDLDRIERVLEEFSVHSHLRS